MRPIAVIRSLIGLAVLLFVGVVLGCWYLLYVDRSHPQSAVEIVVPRGATFAETAVQLASQGVIGNVETFRLLGRLRREEASVRAGEYRFSPHQTQAQVLAALISGGAQVAAWVTIPEGFTAEQVAARLQESGIGSSGSFRRYFLKQSIDVDGAHTKNLEGFLFPDTYLIPLGATPAQAAATFVAQFFRELPRDAAARARALGVDVPQAVTVASLIEREARSAGDRPRIARVIYNRLRLQMPLQVDATIEYALPRHKTELSFGDLKLGSPYNTYLHPGLPPTPIANPGAPSLKAAFFPSRGDDLYYVYCGNGRHVFAKTLAEHQANVARCLH
ncbi:MAG: endolytic transglycosylase MltG [Candidatus Eremiobacteraeota bacterium]|nr:endolytic transglycosylase MltG [Candidatus Eremiobacteraeota bacterium]